MSYEKKTSDDGVTEYYEDGELIAFINDSGKLQAAHGKAKQKPGLEQWIDESGDGSDEDATEPAPPAPLPKKSSPDIGPEPRGSLEAGNKSPEVVAWHFRKDRAAAEVKYARYRHLWPD